MELWDKAETSLDEGQELENSTRLAHLEVEAGGCPAVFRQHVRRFADGTGRCTLSLSSLLSVPPPQWFLRFASGLVLAHSTLSVFLGAFSSSSCGSWGKCRLSVGEVFRRHAA